MDSKKHDPDKPEFLGGTESAGIPALECLRVPRQDSLLFKIDDLHSLQLAALSKRSVVIPKSGPFRKPIPADWIMHMQANIVLRLIDMGMFVYQKGAKQDG
jgi:hypothetical protein